MNSLKICRLCLREAHLPYSLIDEEGAQFLKELVSIEIDESDPFPKSACITCWLNLKLANKIKSNFLESDKKLQSLLFCSDLFDEEGIIPENILLNIIKGISNENTVLDEDHGVLLTIESSTNDRDEISLDIDCGNTKQEKNQSSSVETLKIENMTNSEISIFVVNDEEMSCRICGNWVHESEEMNHIKQHFEIKDNCQICGIECQNLGSLRKHLKKEHNQDMEEVYTCVNCFASFQYKALYKLHKEKAHVNEEEDIETVKYNYMTKKLGMKLGSRGWDILNGSGKEHKCDICNKVYSNSYKLNCHKRDSHTLRQCPKCGKFITAANIHIHIKTHDAQNVSCDLCERSFKNKESLRSHKKNSHSTKEFPCEFCDEVFKIKYSLMLHVKKKHTGVKDFECKECGKSFFTLFKLKQHNNHVHLKNWKYKCSYCEKSCSTRWNLKAHERQHLDARPYVCVHCGEGFKQNISLKNHLQSRHQEIDAQ